MTFWLDAHLDPKLSPWLGSRFKIVTKPLREIGLRAADDDVIIAAARRLAPIVIISKDGGLAKKVQIRSATSGHLAALRKSLHLRNVCVALDKI